MSSDGVSDRITFKGFCWKVNWGREMTSNFDCSLYGGSTVLKKAKGNLQSEYWNCRDRHLPLLPGKSSQLQDQYALLLLIQHL